MIRCVVTTFPREPDYLERTLASLQSAGFEPHVHHGSLGIVPDWLEAARDALDAEFVLLSQDDVVYCRNVRQLLESIDIPTGCVSLYASSKRQTGTGLHRRKPQSNIWGCCALLFRRESLARLLDCRTANNWTHRGKPQTRKLDLLIGRSLIETGMDLWCFSPSLAQHIGHHSSQPGHGPACPPRASADFVGEDFDATQYRLRGHVSAA